MKTKFLLILILSIFTITGMSFDWAPRELPKSVEIAIKTGDASILAKSFNDNVEIIISEKKGFYSRAQAEQLMNNFFESNPPKEFVVLHQGGKSAVQFAIGRLTTQSAVYRFTLFMKSEGDKQLIHQLRIENEHE